MARAKEPTIRDKFAALRGKPGPKPTWLAAAAKQIGYSKAHLSLVERGLRASPAAAAALAEWKRQNLEAS